VPETVGRQGGWVQRFRDAPLDGPLKTLLVAISVCLVCSLCVTTATIVLRPRVVQNQQAERNQHIVDILAGVPGFGGLDVRSIEARVVELDSGAYAESIDAQTYDTQKAASDPDKSIALPRERDLAGIGRRPRWATVYVLRENGQPRLLILPVYGQGFASTLYGYLALDGDGNTIRALSFYEHGETPGLGAQIETSAWQAQWRGKKIRDDQGTIRVRVAKGAAESEYEVDGISGATYTGTGITNLLRFWLGPDGFGSFLQSLHRQGASP
jgi:Na+-transporting NADH:ubiquinone oxidoreductase subunit C